MAALTWLVEASRGSWPGNGRPPGVAITARSMRSGILPQARVAVDRPWTARRFGLDRGRRPPARRGFARRFAHQDCCRRCRGVALGSDDGHRLRGWKIGVPGSAKHGPGTLPRETTDHTDHGQWLFALIRAIRCDPWLVQSTAARGGNPSPRPPPRSGEGEGSPAAPPSPFRGGGPGGRGSRTAL